MSDPWESTETPPTASLTTPLAVIAAFGIFFGLLGMCGGGLGIIGLFTNDMVAELSAQTMTSTQAEAYANLLAASRWIQPISGAYSVLNLLGSVVLTSGAVMVLARMSSGLTALKLGLGAILGLSLLQAVLSVVNYMYIQAPMKEYMAAFMAGAAPGMEGVMGASMAIGVVLGLGWVAVKAIYGLGGLFMSLKA